MKLTIRGIVLALCTALVLAGCKDDGIPVKKMGEPVETAFVTITATDASWVEDTQPLESRWPPETPQGMRYLWVTVEVTNESGAGQPLYYDEFDLLIDGSPRFPERVFLEQQLPEEQVVPSGATVTGDLLYLVPEGAKTLELLYEEYYQGDIPGESFKIKLEV